MPCAASIYVLAHVATRAFDHNQSGLVLAHSRLLSITDRFPINTQLLKQPKCVYTRRQFITSDVIEARPLVSTSLYTFTTREIDADGYLFVEGSK